MAKLKQGSIIKVGVEERIIATVTDISTHASNAADGSMHIPATGTVNSGKALIAGATAGSATWTTITASHISGFNESAQDAVGGILTTGTTDSVTLTYNDASNTITGNVKVDNATIKVNGSGQLYADISMSNLS